MSMPSLSLPLMVLLALVLTANQARALGEILGQTKEQLKLKYDVAVHDHGNGRVTVEFTLADEGRLKPVDAVDLCVPAPVENKSQVMDLAVTLDTKPSADGKRVAHFEIRKDWGERAQIWLTTYWFDGRQLVMTRYHHVIPLARYMSNGPAAGGGAAAEPGVAAPAATERKKD